MGMLDYGQKKVCLMFNIYFKEMKKFFSLIALVGVFAACQPEQIETAFKVAGAKLTVNVSFVDMNGSPYADASLSSSTAGTVSGNTIVFEAAEGTAIAAQEITLTASTPKLATKTRTMKVSTPDIIAGGVGNINFVWPVGDQVDDYTYDLFPKGSPVKTLWDVQFLENKHYDTYAHLHKHGEIEIETWYLNDSEYILTGQVTYQTWLKSYVVSTKANYDVFKPIVEAYALSFEQEIPPVDHTLDFKVSGYGMWNAWQTSYLTEMTYEVKATKGSETLVAGEIVVWSEDTQKAEEMELGMPAHLVGHGVSHHTSYHDVYYHGHDEHGHPHVYEHTYSHDYEIVYPIYSHYVPGHGVAGGASNAGGGIVFPE